MRILLAEDERSLSRAIIALLEKHNYSADAVYDGRGGPGLSGRPGNYDADDPGYYDAQNGRPHRPAENSGSGGASIPILLLTAKSEVDDKVTWGWTAAPTTT